MYEGMTEEQHREHRNVLAWFGENAGPQHIYPQLERFFQEKERNALDTCSADIVL